MLLAARGGSATPAQRSAGSLWHSGRGDGRVRRQSPRRGAAAHPRRAPRVEARNALRARRAERAARRREEQLAERDRAWLEALAGRHDLRLNVGASGVHVEGWIKLDLLRDPEGRCFASTRPSAGRSPTASSEAVNSEHVIEHLELDAAPASSPKPTGCCGRAALIRTSTPNLAGLCAVTRRPTRAVLAVHREHGYDGARPRRPGEQLLPLVGTGTSTTSRRSRCCWPRPGSRTSAWPTARAATRCCAGRPARPGPPADLVARGRRRSGRAPSHRGPPRRVIGGRRHEAENRAGSARGPQPDAARRASARAGTARRALRAPRRTAPRPDRLRLLLDVAHGQLRLDQHRHEPA